MSCLCIPRFSFSLTCWDMLIHLSMSPVSNSFASFFICRSLLYIQTSLSFDTPVTEFHRTIDKLSSMTTSDGVTLRHPPIPMPDVHPRLDIDTISILSSQSDSVQHLSSYIESDDEGKGLVGSNSSRLHDAIAQSSSNSSQQQPSAFKKDWAMYLTKANNSNNGKHRHHHQHRHNESSSDASESDDEESSSSVSDEDSDQDFVDDPWTINAVQREYYTKQFKDLQSDVTKVISGKLLHRLTDQTCIRLQSRPYSQGVFRAFTLANQWTVANLESIRCQSWWCIVLGGVLYSHASRCFTCQSFWAARGTSTSTATLHTADRFVRYDDHSPSAYGEFCSWTAGKLGYIQRHHAWNPLAFGSHARRNTSFTQSCPEAVHLRPTDRRQSSNRCTRRRSSFASTTTDPSTCQCTDSSETTTTAATSPCTRTNSVHRYSKSTYSTTADTPCRHSSTKCHPDNYQQ